MNPELLAHIQAGGNRLREKMDTPNKILDGLWLGNLASSRDTKFLRGAGVAHVLSVLNREAGARPTHTTLQHACRTGTTGVSASAAAASRRAMTIEVEDTDSVDLRAHFDRAFAFIDEGRAAGGCLVHCMAGVSRSATICTAYVMREEGLGAEAALEYVRKRRTVVAPNAGFMRQLREFEADLLEVEGAAGHASGAALAGPASGGAGGAGTAGSAPSYGHGGDVAATAAEGVAPPADAAAAAAAGGGGGSSSSREDRRQGRAGE